MFVSTRMTRMKVDLYHNIRWSRYKAKVFSAMHGQIVGSQSCVDVRFFQIADTDRGRSSLSGVHLDYHQYPHELLFPGSYNAIPKYKLVLALFKKVLRSDADLVLIPGYDQVEYWAMLLAALVRGKKRGTFCDSTLNDRVQSRLKGVLKRVFFGLCHGVFCYGQRAREFLRHYGASEARIIQRFQAAALPEAYSGAGARNARVAMAPPRDAPCFLYVGRFAVEKSLNVLLHAFAAVRSQVPKARLVLVGGGELEAELISLCGSLCIQDAVEFAGGMSQEALAAQYSSATCLVLPSRSEPWGLVVNEALHYGCPVLVSDACGCVPELVINGVSGFVFRADDTQHLASKMHALIGEFTAPDRVADNCMRVIERFTPDNAARQILEGCQTILAAESQ